MVKKFFNILIIVAITQSVSGCFVVAGLAALGGGGYYVGTKAGKREDERIKTQALIDVKRELEEKDKLASAQDQNISTQIGQNYLAGQLNSGIAVYPEVRNGVVILHGRVPDAATAERAIAAARKTSGVQRIISNLVILNQPRPAQQAAPQQMQQGISQQQLQQQYLQQQYLMQQQQMQQNQQLQMVPNYPQMQYQPVQQQQPLQKINYFQLPPTKQNMSSNISAQKKTRSAA